MYRYYGDIEIEWVEYKAESQALKFKYWTSNRGKLPEGEFSELEMIQQVLTHFSSSNIDSPGLKCRIRASIDECSGYIVHTSVLPGLVLKESYAGTESVVQEALRKASWELAVAAERYHQERCDGFELKPEWNLLTHEELVAKLGKVWDYYEV